MMEFPKGGGIPFAIFQLAAGFNPRPRSGFVDLPRDFTPSAQNSRALKNRPFTLCGPPSRS
jgi:hypothetical protein